MANNYDLSVTGISDFTKNPLEIPTNECTIKNGNFYGIALRGEAIAQPDKSLFEGVAPAVSYYDFKLVLQRKNNEQVQESATFFFTPVLNAKRVILKPIDIFVDGDILTFNHILVHYPPTLHKAVNNPEIDIYFREIKSA